LGWLFRSQSRQIQKLNLLVFLTPQVVRDEIDMVELNSKKAREVSSLHRKSRIEEPDRIKQEVFEKLERPAPQNRSTQPNSDLPTPPQQ